MPTYSIKVRQRAGRVGRTGPGRFIMVAPRHAFQFHEDSLENYWQQPVEPARLYPANPNIKNTHGRCLAKETDLNGMERGFPWHSIFSMLIVDILNQSQGGMCI